MISKEFIFLSLINIYLILIHL